MCGSSGWRVGHKYHVTYRLSQRHCSGYTFTYKMYVIHVRFTCIHVYIHVHVHVHLLQDAFLPTEGVDYRGVSTDVTLSPSNPEQCVSVEVMDDSAVELDEFLTMSLSLPAGELSSLQLTQNETTIVATDDDGIICL